MTDFVVAVIVVLIVVCSAVYVVRAKKRGVKCIGCPDGAKCGNESCGRCNGCREE